MIQEEGPTNAGAEAHLGYCEVRYYRLHFFFNDTATTEIYTLSLHDALPICRRWCTRPPTRCSSPARSSRCTTSSTAPRRSEEHTSELQSRPHLVCRLLL